MKKNEIFELIKTYFDYDNDLFESDFYYLKSPQNLLNVKNNKNKTIELEQHNISTSPKANVQIIKNDFNNQVTEQKIESFTNNLNHITNIKDLIVEVEKFNDCPLKTANTKTVFCDGNFKSKILLIGEAPGEDENIHGIPFCGRSGKLLMESLKTIGLDRRSNILITNTVFYRPPLNRAPTEHETSLCKPFVEKLIEISNIQFIIFIGGVSLKTYIGVDSISAARRNIFELEIARKKIPSTALYHPSYLLRSPFKKKNSFYDLLWLDCWLRDNNITKD
jgi:DNA polymerase